jgi:cobalt-zinc-cadmium efflux system membrane fusion protein
MTVEVAQPGAAITTGRIVAVAASIDPASRAILARARLDPSQSLIAGKPVMAALKGTSRQSGVQIPKSALTRIGDKDAVFVRSASGFVIRPVVLAGSTDDKVFLSAGLNPGESVAISAITELKAALGGD